MEEIFQFVGNVILKKKDPLGVACTWLKSKRQNNFCLTSSKHAALILGEEKKSPLTCKKVLVCRHSPRFSGINLWSDECGVSLLKASQLFSSCRSKCCQGKKKSTLYSHLPAKSYTCFINCSQCSDMSTLS